MISRNILFVCCLLCLLNFDQRPGTATATVNEVSSTATANATTTTNANANATSTSTATVNVATPANGTATPTPTPSTPTLTPPSLPPPKGSRRNVVALATGTSAGIGILVCLVIWHCILQFNKRSKQNLNLEAAIKHIEKYSYRDIKKMTDSFKEPLGNGGYGVVYKGRLIDDRLVAVKVLNTSKGSEEVFINEVASISRTSHVNIVTLLGFCLDGQKRALIYEFMPNGSLERYIHAEAAIDGHLGWEKRYQIALGIARGLGYLHKGCTTRIVHFDIKPHNILLDENFCPKISDFGLSKLCTSKESNISMPEARGTVGYIAPEVEGKNSGVVSHKSDVYSYGMMLLEMVGRRKNICFGVSESKICFPRWLHQHLMILEDLKLQGDNMTPEECEIAKKMSLVRLWCDNMTPEEREIAKKMSLAGLWRDNMTPEEREIAKKMSLVGLWCIQNDPSQRPAVNEVIDMLEGSSQALEIPLNTFFR